LHQEIITIVRSGFGSGLAAKEKYSSGDRILGFLVLIRPIFFIMTPLNAAGAVVLGLGGYPSWSQCLLGFCAVAFAGAAVNTFNDYIDRERDRYLWQTRSIPNGRVKPGEVLALVAVLSAASLSMTWFLFNPLTFYILLLAVVLGFLYSAYLRDKVGYLSLPPIVGLIYLGGWAAFSPETLFSNVLPWYLYFLGVAWQAAHIMIYYPLHIIPKIEDKSATKVPPAFFSVASPQVAVKIGAGFTCLTLLLSLLLFLLASLNALYLALVIVATIYVVISVLKLLPDASNKEKGLKAFTSLSIFRMVVSAAILLAVFLSLI
jgi:protoheme IX farnesyltransferase